MYQRKEGIADAYKVDQIDLDSYFFYIFLDICVQIRLFCRKESNEFKQVTYVSYKMEEFKELIENLIDLDFSNIEQCTFQ